MRRLTFTMLITGGLTVTAFAFIRHTPAWIALRLPGIFADKTAAAKAHFYDIPLSHPVDSIVVIKHLRELYVYHADTLRKIYRISLGDAPVGHKHFQGDEKTPEGKYFIDGRNPYSSCHKNLGISYPNSADRAYARKAGFRPGGDIKIHGLPNGQGHIGKGHLLDDWTNGCIAVTDEEIDELYGLTKTGIPIFILP